MNARTPNEALALVEITLDGRVVQAPVGETIWNVADAQGIEIPHLCHKPVDANGVGLRPDGNCRACMVEVGGERTLAASCCRAVSAGMKIETASLRAEKSRALVLELLMSDAGARTDALTPASELSAWAGKLGVTAPRFPRRETSYAVPDLSHPAIAVNLDACIQCTRCLRACREEQGNDVIGLALRGAHSKISFDADAALGNSSCVACGECVQACPTGALMPAREAGIATITKQVDSVCPYCGVGCQLQWNVGPDEKGEETIRFVVGRDGPANHGRLCVKGRYGFDYIHNPKRLTKPLVRRAGAAKDAQDIERVKRGELALDALFRPANWDEALELAAGGLRKLRDGAIAQGLRGNAIPLAGFGSAKGSNEEAYLFQKLVRQGLLTNNVDHCTRLCHASSVAALLEGLGSGAVSNPVADVAQAGFVLLIGANPVVNHPVAATWLKNAVDRGATLCIADPRGNALSRRAKWHLRFRPDTDVALLNALLHVIIEEGLVDEGFVAARVNGYEALKASVAEATPERMSEICGIEPETLREVARAYATSSGSMILWGMGISQHVHGTDNARGLIALAMVTGQIGRPGTGLHPLRGQNNVQGASDAGLIPMMLPNYQRVANDAARAAFEALWGRNPLADHLDPTPGLTVVEIMHAAAEGRIRGLFVEGENPAMSDPDLNHARAALAGLEHLVVQDIFATETAILADVILPASAHAEKWGSYTNTDRLVQIGRPALAPPGDARQDLWAIEQVARRLGLPWTYWHDGPEGEDGDGQLAAEAPVARVFEEMRAGMSPLAGVPWSRLIREGAVVTPAAREDEPGEAVVFTDHFHTPDGRALLVPTTFAAGPETRDADFPFVLTTGRVLEHWHTGAMTRHASMLEALSPLPLVTLHPLDAQALGIAHEAAVELATRHGSVRAVAHLSTEVRRGQVFMAFAYWEAAANRLTGDAIDPVGKIPGFKVTAVSVRAPA
ncbi:molybdopterin-dependent oxidoreductase [Rivibacter subsaxonicus]|uniref:NAD-dependent formate dehydrogenase catalytic subunit /NAD-dependent formate dehydrogenase iron-sulfur protein n=1 Tax=Rivibacter subsaxonicus TaxID=457575 RepID=A0A4Q7VV81_9BURK|nr:molybdopterin-dependent oxidoreductase [Rivibacter subsaxonicus]RZU00530.1 NAD-dependent formate dehydrogenase catalytic subunit /NAD-dependent formate dehydrogenase iron-sulfur protein [Rivibacter subsaxonicus]